MIDLSDNADQYLVLDCDGDVRGDQRRADRTFSRVVEMIRGGEYGADELGRVILMNIADNTCRDVSEDVAIEVRRLAMSGRDTVSWPVRNWIDNLLGPGAADAIAV